jgi:hypothetical protein
MIAVLRRRVVNKAKTILPYDFGQLLAQFPARSNRPVLAEPNPRLGIFAGIEQTDITRPGTERLEDMPESVGGQLGADLLGPAKDQVR